MAVKIVCIAFFALLLLDLSVYRSHGSPLRRSEDSPKVFEFVDTSDTCSLKTKTLWTGHFNWTRLSGATIQIVINQSFVIDYCSGSCKYNSQLINDNYARQMSKLATSCDYDCKELMPCCVAPKPTSTTKFKTKTVFVLYYADGVNPIGMKKYNHTFLEPVECHCQ